MRLLSVSTFTEPSGQFFTLTSCYIATCLFCNGLTARYSTLSTFLTLLTLPLSVKVPTTLSSACILTSGLRPSDGYSLKSLKRLVATVLHHGTSSLPVTFIRCRRLACPLVSLSIVELSQARSSEAGARNRVIKRRRCSARKYEGADNECRIGAPLLRGTS